MNQFVNKLIIKEENYENGFFPKIPNCKKRGSVFLLTDGSNSDIVVNEYTTIREIRRGKYTRVVEISILPYMKEIQFSVPSREAAYSFDVYVKAVIQVQDPITFYENKNIDVDAYFNNLFSLDVKKITRKYSILDYVGMDDELTQKLSSYNTLDKSTGFSYQISVVDATPSESAREFERKASEQMLRAALKKSTSELLSHYTNNYEDAVRAQVVEGVITEEEAILKIDLYKKNNMAEQIDLLSGLREKGLITDKDAKDMVKPNVERVSVQSILDKKEIGVFFEEEE